MPKSIPVAIIGSGPAGYTAAVYAARAKLNPVLFAGYQSGGQLMWTTDVENFPGFPAGVAGPQLMVQMREQAQKFGADIQDVHVTAVDFTQRPFRIWTALPEGVAPEIYDKGTAEEVKAVIAKIKKLPATYEAESVILSTGASSIMLNVPGEMKLLGRGVSTCAVCDAAFYRERDTFVVGGGDSAMEDTLALTKFAKTVTVIHRRDSFRASKIMQERVLNHPKVKVLWNSQILEVIGEQKVDKLKIQTGPEIQEVPADGVFIAIGHRPITRIFDQQVMLDEHGYIVTRHSLSAKGLELARLAVNEKELIDFPSMTSAEGVFAAGDVVDVRYKQAITAAGQGCQAAIDAERWLEKRG
ncbi:MAG TPA: FAD-dependent oxidoreductase [Vitreimonas sp.]|nr:FAD-dependent oxidoreductase [Vitreimonas sp.]